MKHFALIAGITVLLVSACIRPPSSKDDAVFDGSKGSSVSSIANPVASVTSSSSSSISSFVPAPIPVGSAASSSEPEPEPDMSADGIYADLDASVIGNGETSVLFFHASWCPICRAEDDLIAEWYASEWFPVSTYKVDYDTAGDLRARYGVTYQHTFVKIDGSGKAVVTLSAPSESQLRGLLLR